MTLLKDIYDQFDLFLIDQFGVLHDGATVYSSALQTLVRLQENKKKVVIISNSSKRSSHNEKRLEDMGVSAHLWNEIVTSGEVAWWQLNKDKKITRKRCFILANDDDLSSFEGFNITHTSSAHGADYVLIAGTRPDTFSMEEYKSQLRPFALKNVPAICTNPDLKLVAPTGSRAPERLFGPGVIAHLYEELGGTVEWIGKPYSSIYTYISNVLGLKGRTLCIGDSIEHDIVGAQNLEARTLFINSGLYASPQDLEKSLSASGVAPDYKAEKLAWSA